MVKAHIQRQREYRDNIRKCPIKEQAFKATDAQRKKKARQEKKLTPSEVVRERAKNPERVQRCREKKKQAVKNAGEDTVEDASKIYQTPPKLCESSQTSQEITTSQPKEAKSSCIQNRYESRI